jgi:hypothetical protein
MLLILLPFNGQIFFFRDQKLFSCLHRLPPHVF